MNKLYSHITFFLLLSSLNLFAQKEANIWYFGENAGLDFSTNPPTALTDGLLSTDEGCSSFSDGNGNLLFYSDGITVYNKNHQIMQYSNGDLANNLQGNPSSTQSGMIIPKPGSTSIYYLFSVGTDFVPTADDPEDQIQPNPGFNYYTIDMSLNSGLGEITEGPVNLALNPTTNEDLSEFWSEKVAAVKGEECNTFWVISFVLDTFYAYKIDNNGVDINNVVTSQVNYTSPDKRGYLAVSPDGSKIAFADFNSSLRNGTINGSLLLFDFDDETGIINTNPETLIQSDTNQSPYGVAFSQNSTKLYANVLNDDFDDNFNIYQFDLNEHDITESISLINARNGFRGALQLAPDGKIYIPIRGTSFLDVIENPNENAEDVIYTENGINLNGKLATQGLPPFIASLLLPIQVNDSSNNQTINNQDLQYCRGENIIFETETITGNNITYEWTYTNETDQTSIVSPNATLSLTNISTTNNGTYNLYVSLEDECGNTTSLEATFNIEVFEPAIANKPDDISFCNIEGIDSFDFRLTTTPQVLGLQDAIQFEILYFLTNEDALNNENPIGIISTVENEFSSQIIYARIHNREAPEACFDITSFNLSIFQTPQPSQPSDIIVCDDLQYGGDTDGFFNGFLLSSKDAEILSNTEEASQFSISYHTSLTGAETSALTNVIDKENVYRNAFVNQQTIYVRIENIYNPECFVVSQESSEIFKPFSLIVNPLPTINAATQLIQCDSDDDSNTLINLTLAEINISDNYTTETFKYFPTENDAINETSEIISPTSYSVNNEDIIWVKVISANNCYRLSELTIIVSFTPSSINYTQNFVECDDEFDDSGNDSDSDGITTFDLSSVSSDVLLNFPISIQNELEVFVFETIEDRDLLTNPIDLGYYRNDNEDILKFTPQNLYIKVINTTNNNCSGIGAFTIETTPLPNFEVTTPQVFCLNNSPLTLQVESPEDIYSYEWRIGDDIILNENNSSIEITSAGDYFVTATNDLTDCSKTKEITVTESSIAVIDRNIISVTEDSNNNSITINEELLEIGDYEYAIFDDVINESDPLGVYQDEPIFENLEGGIYTIAIRDKNNCGIVTFPISILEFPKFVTPNNDGYNDTWIVKGITTDFYPSSTILIFDRYGKNLAEINFDESWDGTFNGNLLPTNDYWYTIQLVDNNGNIKNKKGNFSLIR